MAINIGGNKYLEVEVHWDHGFWEDDVYSMANLWEFSSEVENEKVKSKSIFSI